MNIGVHVSFQISVFGFFSGYIPGRGIAESYEHRVFFLWLLQCVNTITSAPWRTLCLSVCLCVTGTPPPNPLESQRQMPWHFAVNKDVLLHDHSTVPTLRKFSIDTTLLALMESIFRFPWLSQSCPYGLWREEQGLLLLIKSSRILLRIIFCICSGLFSFFWCRSSLKPFAFLSSHWHIWRAQVSCFVEHSSIWTYLFPHVYIYIFFSCLKTHLHLFLRPCLQTDLLKILNCFTVFLKSFLGRGIFSVE